jgi:hypothetical protein
MYLVAMASLDPQKNFYDEKRYFQGKDNPGDPHPAPAERTPIPMGQVVFGLIFLGFIGFLAWLNVRGAQAELHATPAPIQATK